MQSKTFRFEVAAGARSAVGIVAALLVLWSFYHVIHRALTKKALAANQVQLTVLHWGDKNEDKVVADLARDFEKQNPDIRILRMNLGQAPAVRTKLQTMLAAGEPPDAFYLGLEDVSDLGQKNLLADVEEMIREDKAAGEPTINLDEFYPSVIRCFRVNPENGQVGTGTLVGVPKDFTTVGFYYNKDLFRRAGIPEPSPDGWTWDEFHAAAQAIGKLPGCYGADFVTWEQMIRIVLWTHGLEFASPGWQQPFYFNDSRVHAVLEDLQSWFHKEHRTLMTAKTQMETMQEPFLAGNIGLTGPYGRWKCPTYRLIKDFDWDIAPLPQKDKSHPRNGVFTVSWGISRQSPHRREAWKFVKYLASVRGQELMAQSGLAIPVLKSVAEKELLGHPDEKPKHARVFLDAADVASPTDFPPDPQYLQQFRVRIEEIFKLNQTVGPALAKVDKDWKEDERRAGIGKDNPHVPWGQMALFGGVPLLLVAVIAAGMWWRGRPGGLAVRDELAGVAMVSPWVLGFIVFTAFSIVLTLILSFSRWSALTTLPNAQFVGWDNYRSLVFEDSTFRISLRKTAWYALLAVPSSQVLALIAAMLMNREWKSIGVFRAIWYLPSVLAGVGVAVMWKWVFHHEHGMIKTLLDPILPAGMHTPAWFEKGAETWGVPAFAILNLWSIGGTMMIYLAGLKGIPKDLYEAAEIDGAVGWRKFVNVTLPMLSPVIFFNVIIAIIASFQVFTQAQVMTGGGPGDATRFYVVYLYNQAFDFHAMGYASAMAWLLLLIVLVLTLVVMKGTKRFVYYEALKA